MGFSMEIIERIFQELTWIEFGETLKSNFILKSIT